MIVHLATDLPWCWKIGKANPDERGHLRAMMGLLPSDTLLVADAGYTGYALWRALIESGHSILVRVGSNVRLLRKLGCATREHDGIVYLWPDEARRRSQPPLILRWIAVRDGDRTMHVLTNVLDASRLSEAQAVSIYRMRWGLEVGFRSIKQTMDFRKLRSDAPVQAALETRWMTVSWTLLRLISVRAILERAEDPRRLSFAAALATIRRMMRQPDRRMRRTDGLMGQLGRALKDTYQRHGSRTARNWPHKKTEQPPGHPKIRNATAIEIAAAQRLKAKERAA